MDRTSAPRPENESYSIMPAETFQNAHSLISSKSQVEIGKSQINLPSYKVVLPLSISSSFLIDSFKFSCKKHKFLISEQSSSSITATHTVTSTIRNLFTCIMPLSEEKKARSTSVVKFSIMVNDKNCSRIIFIQGLHGFANKIHPVIQTFQEILEKNSEESEKIKDDEGGNEFNNFQIAYYQINRFLNNSETQSGKVFQNFLQEFNDKYQFNQEHTQDTRKILSFIRENIENINEIIAKSVLSHSKSAIEKYTYSKVFSELIKIYEFKKTSIINEFIKKRECFKVKSDEELLKILGVKEKFQLKGKNNIYLPAIESLNEISKHVTPVDQLNCILKSTTHMKTAVVDYWKGREEIETMDDQLPVIIFIVCRTDLENFPAIIEFLIDYTQCNHGMDNENRLLINYDAAISYIINEM